MTRACEDANSKLIEVVTVADVDDEDRVDEPKGIPRAGNSDIHRSSGKILKLKFG